MHDLMQQVMNYLKGMWRYRWYAMAGAWIVILIGWFIVARMPDEYRASARVYVNTDTILRPLLRGLTVETNVNQRLGLMTKTLLSRPNLEKVARMTDLDLRAKTPEAMESLLNRMASHISIRSTRRENLYTISYEHHDPQLAKRVVQALLTIFVESTLGETRADSDSAQKFIGQQIQDYQDKLVKAENRLMDFKRKHMGMLPGQGGDFFARLETASSDLSQAKLSLKEAVNRRDELKRQLDDSEESVALYTVPSTPVTSALDARIETLQSRLDQLLLKYTKAYPDVKEIEATIAALKKQKSEEIAALASEPKTDNTATENPMQQQLQLALGEADANIAAMKVRVKEYEERVSNLRKMVDTLPVVETELKRLNRDYSINKKNYDTLVTRRESAKLSEEAGQTGDDVRFRVIDPPRVPLNPSGPNRFLYSTLVLFAGIGLGIAIAFLLSQLSPTIHDRRSLRQLTGIPVFGSISKAWTAEALLKRRLELGGFAAASVFLVISYSAVVYVYVHEGEGSGILHFVRTIV